MSRSERVSRIAGLGSRLPEKVLTNFDLEKMVDTSNEWIVTRTGIRERRILDESVPGVRLAKEAAEKALKSAGMTAGELDMIITGTITSDMATPSTACVLQSELGAVNATAFDINAACSGFVYGLTITDQFIKNGTCSNVLVVGVDALSRVTDWTDRNTCVLFGDGAGAAVIKAEDRGERGVLATYIGADGSLWHNLTCPQYFVPDAEKEKRQGRNPRTIWMDGSEVFKFAVKIMEQATLEVTKRAGISLDDVSLIVPHQANIRIVEGAAKRLNYPLEKIFTNIDRYGNMSAASIPVALEEAQKEGKIKEGQNIVLVGFGGGMTWGAAAIRW